MDREEEGNIHRRVLQNRFEPVHRFTTGARSSFSWNTSDASLGTPVTQRFAAQVMPSAFDVVADTPWSKLMRKVIIGTIILITTSVAASPQENAAVHYEMVYRISGFLLRAGYVCGGDKQMIRTAFEFVGSPEYKAISKSFPKQTARWMAAGTESFNTIVMSEGLAAACAFAKKKKQEAQQIMKKAE
jgi:hypothetical protein